MPRLRPRNHLDITAVSHLHKDLKQNPSSRDFWVPGAWNPGWNYDFTFQLHLESAMQQLSLSVPEQYVVGVKKEYSIESPALITVSIITGHGCSFSRSTRLHKAQKYQPLWQEQDDNTWRKKEIVHHRCIFYALLCSDKTYLLPLSSDVGPCWTLWAPTGPPLEQSVYKEVTAERLHSFCYCSVYNSVMGFLSPDSSEISFWDWKNHATFLLSLTAAQVIKTLNCIFRAVPTS